MRTILLVDDQPSVVSTLTYILSSSGHDVLSATNGAEALKLAENHPFDFALIDLHMPGMDGIAVCRVLCERARGTGCQALIWIMAAAYTTEAAKLAAEAGARALLKKPFDCGEWMKEVDRCLATCAPATPDGPPPPATVSTPGLYPAPQQAVA